MRADVDVVPEQAHAEGDRQQAHMRPGTRSGIHRTMVSVRVRGLTRAMQNERQAQRQDDVYVERLHVAHGAVHCGARAAQLRHPVTTCDYRSAATAAHGRTDLALRTVRLRRSRGRAAGGAGRRTGAGVSGAGSRRSARRAGQALGTGHRRPGRGRRGCWGPAVVPVRAPLRQPHSGTDLPHLALAGPLREPDRTGVRGAGTALAAGRALRARTLRRRALHGWTLGLHALALCGPF